MAKIVVLNGSPHPKGTTAALVTAFSEAAQGVGNEVQVLNLQRLKIHGCAGCNACYKTGKPCAFSDDSWNDVAEDVLTADVVVFSGPVYWYGMTAQLKAALDRMYCFLPRGDEFRNKRAIILSAAMEPEKSVFDGVVIPIERSAALMGWDVVGKVLADGCGTAADLEGKDFIAQATELGASIA